MQTLEWFYCFKTKLFWKFFKLKKYISFIFLKKLVYISVFELNFLNYVYRLKQNFTITKSKQLRLLNYTIIPIQIFQFT